MWQWPQRTKLAIAIALGLNLYAVANDSEAQSYPTKPLRLIVPVPAGSAPDTLGRVVARGLGEVLTQQIIVDNRPGAGATIGLAATAKAPADGYTLAYSAVASVALRPVLFPSVGLDAARDLFPIGTTSRSRLFLLVGPALPVATLPYRAASPPPRRSSPNAPRTRGYGMSKAASTSTLRAVSPCSTPATAIRR